MEPGGRRAEGKGSRGTRPALARAAPDTARAPKIPLGPAAGAGAELGCAGGSERSLRRGFRGAAAALPGAEESAGARSAKGAAGEAAAPARPAAGLLRAGCVLSVTEC